MVWEIIEFDNAAYARKLRGRRKQDVQEKHLAIKRRLLSSMTAAGVGLAASIHTVGISTAFAGVSLRRADILRQKKKILEEHMACNGWEEIDMDLGDVALAVGPIAVASAVAPGVEHLTTHLAGHGTTDFIAQNIGHTVHAAEHAPGAFADAVAGGVHDQATAVLHGLGGDPTHLVNTYDVMNSSVHYAGNAVGQAGAQYAEIQAAEHGSEALAKKFLQRQTREEAKARAAAEKTSPTALRNSTDEKNAAVKTWPEVKASSDRTVSNTKQFTSNSTSFPTPPGVDPSQLRYLQAFKPIPTNNTSSPSEEGPMGIWPSSAAFLLLTLLFHGPPTINSIFGHEAAFVWAAPFIFLALTLKAYKLTFLTAMGMMALIAFLYPSTDLWTYSLILQACVAVKQYRSENLVMRSPGFRVRHVDKGPLDCWPGTLCNALFSLYMLSGWSEEGYAFISGAMLISLILSATHLRPTEPITMDLAYPKRALLDLLYNPIIIAAILAPVCICSEDDTTLYTSGGLTAAVIIYYLRSRIMDTAVERLGYKIGQFLFNSSTFRIILLLIAASGCVCVWWIVLPRLVFWTAAAIMLFIRSPWVV